MNLKLTLTARELDSLARKTGFQKNSLEKVLRLAGVLSTLQDNPATQKSFALKGGTALNIFLADLPRLSVDIDLNYILHVKKEKMIKDKEAITEGIPNVFSGDYSVEKSRDEYALTEFSLRYNTLAGSKDLLKIDINYVHRLPILPIEFRHCEMYGYGTVDYPCVAIPELLAGKIIALLDRKTPRDLFDVNQIAHWSNLPDKSTVKPLLLYYGLGSEVQVPILFNSKINTITSQQIKNNLLPMLRSEVRFDLGNAVREVETFLAPLLALDENERRALEHFYRTGEILYDDLIPQQGMHAKMKESPYLEWKIKKIKKHLKK